MSIEPAADKDILEIEKFVTDDSDPVCLAPDTSISLIARIRRDATELAALRSKLEASEARSALLAKALEPLSETLNGWRCSPGANFEVVMKGHKWNDIMAALAVSARTAAAYVGALEREHEAVQEWNRLPKTSIPEELRTDEEKNLEATAQAVEAARKELNR